MSHVVPSHIRARIDVFAVRQFPGNGADLDFRGVLAECTAAIVAAAPIEGTLLNDFNADYSVLNTQKREEFRKSDEYAAAAKVLPFCRLWCVHTQQNLPPPFGPSPCRQADPSTDLRLVTCSYPLLPPITHVPGA